MNHIRSWWYDIRKHRFGTKAAPGEESGGRFAAEAAPAESFRGRFALISDGSKPLTPSWG
jgi:hypothetical protein